MQQQSPQDNAQALREQADALLAQRRRTARRAVLWLVVYAILSGALLTYILVDGTFLQTLAHRYGTFLLAYLVIITVGTLSSARTNKQAQPLGKKMPLWTTAKNNLARLVAGDRFGKQAEKCIPLLQEAPLRSDLPRLLTLSQALFPAAWWMREAESKVHFTCLTELHHLLPRATAEDIAALSPAQRRQLTTILNFFLTTPTGWYLDTELPICILLALASAPSPELDTFELQAAQSHPDPRVQEAAKEYLLALRGEP